MMAALKGDFCKILGEKKDRDELACGKLRSFLAHKQPYGTHAVLRAPSPYRRAVSSASIRSAAHHKPLAAGQFLRILANEYE
jgi:hypothetical protein